MRLEKRKKLEFRSRADQEIQHPLLPSSTRRTGDVSDPHRWHQEKLVSIPSTRSRIDYRSLEHGVGGQKQMPQQLRNENRGWRRVCDNNRHSSRTSLLTALNHQFIHGVLDVRFSVPPPIPPLPPLLSLASGIHSLTRVLRATYIRVLATLDPIPIVLPKER